MAVHMSPFSTAFAWADGWFADFGVLATFAVAAVIVSALSQASGGIGAHLGLSFSGSLDRLDRHLRELMLPRLRAFAFVAFYLLDFAFAALYGAAFLHSRPDGHAISLINAWMAQITVGADWIENALILVLLLSLPWREPQAGATLVQRGRPVLVVLATATTVKFTGFTVLVLFCLLGRLT